MGSTFPVCAGCFRARYFAVQDGFRSVAILRHPTCANCGGAHHIQNCGEIWSALRKDYVLADLQFANLTYCLSHGLIDRLPAFAEPAPGWGVVEEGWPA
jgi:hypothetical protein